MWEKGDAGRGGDGEGEGDGKDGGGERGKRRGEEVVKVYCWGEVVGEMWLLLFIGSGRKIKGVGVRWVDAGGEAVMVMG